MLECRELKVFVGLKASRVFQDDQVLELLKYLEIVRHCAGIHSPCPLSSVHTFNFCGLKAAILGSSFCVTINLVMS